MNATAMPVPFRAASLGLSYRTANADDRDLLALIYRSTRAEEVAATGWPESQQLAFLQMQFDAQQTHYQAHYPNALWLVVERAGASAGRLYLEDWSRETRVIDIALLPEHRGQGIGEAILRDLMERAATSDRAVTIHVEKTNRAMSLYRRLGFVSVEDKGVYDLMKWRP